jgi:hypothetical protein
MLFATNDHGGTGEHNDCSAARTREAGGRSVDRSHHHGSFAGNMFSPQPLNDCASRIGSEVEAAHRKRA